MKTIIGSHRWKQLERDVAAMFGGVRVHRQIDLLRRTFESAPDVVIDAGPFRFLVECKALKKFTHHRLLRTCRDKYCNRGEVPALATREHNGRTYVTIEAGVFAELLRAARELHAAKRAKRSA
jgi:hypothetical protein